MEKNQEKVKKTEERHVVMSERSTNRQQNAQSSIPWEQILVVSSHAACFCYDPFLIKLSFHVTLFLYKNGETDIQFHLLTLIVCYLFYQ